MFPKTRRQENPHLRRMAQHYGCQMLYAPGCRGDETSTTVMAHSNWSDLGGKGGARKADDSAAVYACVACHSWLDAGKASADEKRAAFEAALVRQKRLYQWVLEQPAISPRERDAAAWALERLKLD